MAKICVYSVATHLGGAERSLLEYLRYVRTRTKDSVDLLLPKSSGPLVDEVRRIGIEPTVLPFPAALLGTSRHSGRMRLILSALAGIPSSLAYFARLTAHLRRTRPDLVYTSGLKCHVLGSLAGLASGTPVVWHLRDHIPVGPLRTLLRGLHALVPRLRIAANSLSTASCVPFAAEPFVVYNGINPEQFAFRRSDCLLRELALPASAKIIGIVGVLARWKGQVEFLRMAQLLATRHPSLHFVVVGDQIYDTAGDSGYRQKLGRLAEEYGLAGRLSFLGYRMDTAAVIQSLDVLVHASIRPEPFGRVIIEALACGTPVTASDLGGPTEIITPGLDGLLHRAGDPAAMAANVEKLLFSEAGGSLARQGRQRVLEAFTHEAYAAKLHAFVTAPVNSDSRDSATAS